MGPVPDKLGKIASFSLKLGFFSIITIIYKRVFFYFKHTSIYEIIKHRFMVNILKMTFLWGFFWLFFFFLNKLTAILGGKLVSFTVPNI